MTTTSWELVAAAQGGDADAFGQLWRRYRPSVAHYIASRVQHRQTTEDLTSETFIRAWRSIGTVQNQGSDICAWLIRIARNITIDHSRSAHATRSTPVAEFDAGFDLLPPTVGPEITVPQQRGEAWASERLDWLIGRLSAPQAAVIRGRYYAGMSITETAKSLGCTEAAAKSAQHRAVTNLAAACLPARSSFEFTEAGLEPGRAS